MPFQLGTKVNQLHCSWCGKIVRDNPIVVKTCCNNKPWVFCSKQCYNNWVREWLKMQEQKTGTRKGQLL